MHKEFLYHNDKKASTKQWVMNFILFDLKGLEYKSTVLDPVLLAHL